MNKLIAIAWKDLRLRFTSPTEWLFFLILPFYYIITYPIAYLLNWADVSMKHSTGTGVIMKAWK